jgi:hypothetical protein
MSRRFFFIGCGYQVFAELAKHFHYEHNWELIYWTTSPANEQNIRDNFPQTIFHSVLDAVRLIPPSPKINIKPYPVGQSLLDQLATHENSIYWQMERVGSGDQFTFAERSLTYHRYLEYWGGVLKEYQPDVVLFPTAPHLVYDYVLYLLCRLWSIETIVFDSPGIYPDLLFVQHSFEEGSPEVIERYRKELADYKGESVPLSDTADNYFKNVRLDYNQGAPEHVKKLVAKAKESEEAGGWHSKLGYIKRPWRLPDAAKKAYSYLTSDAPPNYIKKRGVSIEKSFMTGLEWRRAKARRKAIYRHLNQFYVSHAETAPLNVAYVYLALHYQPERTTSPLGGVFVDQLLIIDLLRASLPEDWFIYVKEAPTHFWPNVVKQVCRSEDFYKQILTRPKTKLLSMDMDPFMLLDNAKAVATITGTSAWEAVIRGVPALVFGHAWYRGCEGVYTIRNGEDIRAAVNEIEKGFKPDLKKVRLFNKVLEDLGTRAYVEPRYKYMMNVSDEDNIKLLAEAVMAKLN